MIATPTAPAGPRPRESRQRRRLAAAAGLLPRARLGRRPCRPAGRCGRSSCPPAAGRRRRSGRRCDRSRRPSALLPGDGALQLVLRHVRPTLDVELLSLVGELVAGAALRPVGAGTLSPALARRLRILDRASGSSPRLARAGALLVDRARRDLLGRVLGLSLALDAVLDMLVLAGALGALL